MESWNQTSTDAVRSHAPDGVNKRIDERVERCVRHMAEQDRPEITRYLEKLEREWDLNRAVMVAGSMVSLLGLWLARRDGGGWRVLGGVAAGLVLQHGLTGFGPLAELVRAVGGIRTRKEIDLEKFALKALRGDFERIPRNDGGPLARANAALVAAQS
jgi:pimeloyl-ACP methyl ester carboxylesterase